MKKSDLLKRIKDEADANAPDLFDSIVSTAKEQGIVQATSAAKLGAAHAAGGAGTAAAAGSSKIIIGSLIAALAVTAAVGGTVGASLAVNSANKPGGSNTPPAIENPNPPAVIATEGLEYSEVYGGVSYCLSGLGTVTDTEIVIPSTYKGKPVSSIGQHAFSAGKNITKITLSDSITVVGAYAFENCSNLKSVTMTDNVEYIGIYAFKHCPELESVTLPANITYLPQGLFEECEKLTQINLPDKLEVINNYAFSDSGLTSIEFPASVKEIGEAVFSDCKNLTSVSINSNMTVGIAAFRGCELLSDIDVGDKEVLFGEDAISATAYGNNTANYQDNILYIGKNLVRTIGPLYHVDYTIKWGTLTISPLAFRYAQKSLAEIYIPDTVRKIGEGAFNYCEELEKITVGTGNATYYSSDNCLIERDTQTLIAGCKTSVIGDDVLHVGNRAFYAITGLERITFSPELKSIGDSAFGQCDGLQEIVFPYAGNIQIGDGAFRHCTNVQSIVLGASVTGLSHYTFLQCETVTSITVTVMLSKIGLGAFMNCYNLKTIYYNGKMGQWKDIQVEGEEYYEDGVHYSAFGLTGYDVVCIDGTLHYD